MIYTHVLNRGVGVKGPADALEEGMTWNDMRNADKIPAVADPVEKLLIENELADSRHAVLSRPETAKEFYPETRYT